MKIPRVLFARIGWMKFYAGIQPDDEKPKGGGAYTKEYVGGEVFNFLNLGGKFYGYLQPHARFGKNAVEINLERIAPKHVKYAGNADYGDRDYLDNVLVVFVAKSPSEGQIIVGWYKNAKVYRGFLEKRRKVPKYVEAHWYNIEAKVSRSVLLPTDKRTHHIPNGHCAMGQANACYQYENNLDRKDTFNWVRDAISYVDSYEGENLIKDPHSEDVKEIELISERNASLRSGQGFRITQALRKKIEDYSVGKAKSYFKSKKYSVKNVGSIRSYDLECHRNSRKLAVEVKGTTTVGQSVLLTKNEVENANRQKTALFVLYSIKVHKRQRRYHLSGGVMRVFNPWRVDRRRLTPLSYSYEL